MDDTHGAILLASVVALLAIVGLILAFNGQVTGAAFADRICPAGQQLQLVTNPYISSQNYYGCVPLYDDVRYIPQDAGTLDDSNLGVSFQTEADKKVRNRGIITKTWDY